MGNCIRCSGFMVPEIAYDGTTELKTLRCVNCGMREGDRLRNPVTGKFDSTGVPDKKSKGFHRGKNGQYI